MPFSAGKNQVGGILDPAQTTLSLNQRRTMERLVAEGIDRRVAKQLAIALVKTALTKADWNEADHPRADNGQFGNGPTVGKKEASAEQKANAVSAYGNFSYRDINEAAVKYDSSKGGGDKEEKRLRQHVESLSQAIHDDKLEKDTKLYRGFRLPAGAKEGDVLQPHGFTSASTSKAVANGFAQQAGTDGGHERVVATILAPKGMPALDREKYGGANTNKSEKEFIFDHRQSFRIVKDNCVNAKGVRQITIEPVASHSLAKSEGHVPPQGVRDACRRGLSLAGEYGGPGLTEGAKSRARSMAAGESQTDEQLARIRSFTARHDSYEKKTDPPSPGYVSWLLWGGDAGKSWANSKGEKTEKSAVSLAKSALARVQLAKRSYHEAFSAACKEILPQGVVDKIHVRARAIAGGHGKAAARAAAQAESTDMTKSDAKPMGAAFARAKATGKDQSHAARKRRANKFLREKGHAPIGRDVKKTAPLPADVRAEQFLKLARQRRKKREADKAEVAKACQVDLSVPTTIIKAEETQWQKLLWSVVYEPDVFDSHGDRMDAATIQKAAHEAFRQGMYVNHEHVGPPIGAHIVESFTAPVDFTIDDSEGAHVIRKGTWVVGTQVTDDAVWDKVLKGEYGGVSLEGTAFARTLDEQAA